MRVLILRFQIESAAFHFANQGGDRGSSTPLLTRLRTDLAAP